MKLLNQYTSRTVPGYVNVLGTATNPATVSLWSPESTALYASTTRKGEYFRGELPFHNSTNALWLTITNVAVWSNSTGADIVTNTVGKMLLAKTPEAFTYDTDGNLTSDSLWTNGWNGENRRSTIESRTTLPASAKVKEQWTHLADGRWIERIVSTNNGTSYYPAFTNRYVWDGQILLAVLDHTNGLVLSFLRGIDLSGSIQGAGGVGGVLAVRAGTSAQCGAMVNTTHFTCYDGNGNVTALVDAATGAESARYEDGPFAEPLRMTGPMAKLNPIRFSTQYHDDFTEDDKYLFRDLRDGRWPNRDPIAERGGLNLYGFVANNPVSRVDAQGLYAFDMGVKAYIVGTRVTFGPWTFNAGTKVDHIAHVDTDAESLTQTKFIGTTIKYDSSGNEVDRATASSGGLRAYIRCKKISTRVGCCKECHIQIIGTASDPLFYGAAPPLDYDFFVSVTVCPGSIYFYYSGSHDGYPSYDFNLAGDQVHHFSHVAAGTSPLSLYSWGQYHFRGDKWLMTRL